MDEPQDKDRPDVRHAHQFYITRKSLQALRTYPSGRKLMQSGRKHQPPPDTLPKAVWSYLMENAQTVVVTLAILILIVVIVPPMVGSQRAAHNTIAQSCAGALQSALASGENGQSLGTLLKLDDVRAACAYPTLHIIPLPQPATFAVQNTSGTHTYIVTPTSLTRTP